SLVAPSALSPATAKHSHFPTKMLQ
ncbi:hypothetical protein EE612_058444, partial [Oryza sativa]